MKPKRYENLALKHRFSDAELREISDQMAMAVEEKETLDEELKEVKAAYKEKLTIRENQISLYARNLRQKFETRQIECSVEYDYDEKVVKYIRQDTFAEVKRRNMTNAELQIPLDDAEEAKQ